MTHSDYERWVEVSDRAAVGETLSEGEQEFLRGHIASDPVAHAEAALWASMADFGIASSEELDRALADRAVGIVLSERRRASRSRRTLAWAGGGCLAAAAAVAVFVSSRSGNVGVTAHGLGAVVEYVGGEARADGARVGKGTELAAGSVVEAVAGPICVAVEPRIHACLAGGAKVKLSSIGTPERRLDLLAGKVAVALYPLPRGERFSVVAGGVWSTAVGTAFTVQFDSGAIETIVHEGKVAVGRGPGGSVVGAHKIGLSRGGEDVAVEPLSDHGKTETPEWVALASVAQRSIEAPVPAEPPKAEVAPEPLSTSAAASVDSKVQPHAALVTKVAPPLATDLLATARQSLRDQRWSDAAAAYQKLIGVYPESPEARTVVVPLAKLEIDRLGQPAAALPSLNAYIDNGGSLVMEARSARIRAYRALGKTAEELRAIDEFLAAHPNSLEAEKLRERREALRTH